MAIFVSGSINFAMVKLGIKGRFETIVTTDNIATSVGSGKVKVLSTPNMITLMEKAALLSIEPYLEEGQSSVGTHLNVSHCSSTPVGMKVWAESEVIEIDRRRISFSVKAFDERGLIGEGTHDRFIIDIDKFQTRTDGKLHLSE